MQVKINQKKYTVPELTFEHYTTMEDQGFSIVDAVDKKQYMLLAMGFTCVVTGTDRREAERLLTQHVLGGGNIREITNAFFESVNQSDFFMKMLGLVKKKEETAEKVQEKEEEPTEEIQNAEIQEEISEDNQENKSE